MTEVYEKVLELLRKMMDEELKDGKRERAYQVSKCIRLVRDLMDTEVINKELEKHKWN